MSVRLLLASSLLVLATACGDDGGSGTADAATTPDSSAGGGVMMVTCPASPAVTITTQAAAFDMPTATITAGSIVRLVSTPGHPIGPFPGGGTMTDPALTVSEGQSRCFQFANPGTFKFICTAHQYAGTLTVN